MDFEGMDVNTDFGDFTMPELADMGIDLGKLNLGDLSLPQAIGLAGVASTVAGQQDEEEDMVASLENPLLKPKDEGPLFSRQILESTPIV